MIFTIVQKNNTKKCQTNILIIILINIKIKNQKNKVKNNSNIIQYKIKLYILLINYIYNARVSFGYFYLI